jgi:hypothetical protein
MKPRIQKDTESSDLEHNRWKMMRVADLKLQFPIYEERLDEYSRESKDKKPEGRARFALLENGKRVGKLYWDKITIVRDRKRKVWVEIFTLNGFKLSIWKECFSIFPYKKMDDNCYISSQKNSFDAISFYGKFDFVIHVNELASRN